MKILAAYATAPKMVRLGLDRAVDISNFVYTFHAMDVPAVSVHGLEIRQESTALQISLDRAMTPKARYRLIIRDESLRIEEEVFLLGYTPAQPKSRQFQLLSMLPRHNRRADTSGDLNRFIACLQEVLDGVLTTVDQFPDIFDLERCPEHWIDSILYDLGNPFRFELAPIEKRRLASVLVGMYREKGTTLGIENAIRFFLGIESQVRPWSNDTLSLGESELGESELGEDWVLGLSSSFVRYAFDVQVTDILSPTQRTQIRTLVDYLKPAHTRFVTLLEPTPPPLLLHWELGWSDLGETTILH